MFRRNVGIDVERYIIQGRNEYSNAHSERRRSAVGR
jgi:hypothetical protein